MDIKVIVVIVVVADSDDTYVPGRRDTIYMVKARLSTLSTCNTYMFS